MGETIEVSCLTMTSTDNSAFGSGPLGGFALPFQSYRLKPAW